MPRNKSQADTTHFKNMRSFCATLYEKRLDEKLTAKEESDLTEIYVYENIMKSLHGTAEEVLGGKTQKTKP
jgi:hypothetical protein